MEAYSTDTNPSGANTMCYASIDSQRERKRKKIGRHIKPLYNAGICSNIKITFFTLEYIILHVDLLFFFFFFVIEEALLNMFVLSHVR